MYRIAQTAARLDVSPSQILRWTREFGRWLTAEATLANPGSRDGVSRLTPSGYYSEDDINILRRIQQWQHEGMSDEEIVARLTAQNRDEATVEGALHPLASAKDSEAMPPSAGAVPRKAAPERGRLKRGGRPRHGSGQRPRVNRANREQLAANTTRQSASQSAPPADKTAEIARAGVGKSSNREEGQRDDGSISAGLVKAAPPSSAQLLQRNLESQQALLATQQQQRELLTTLREQSSSLRVENIQLRKRLRMMEEQMSRLKEYDWNQRQLIEERMAQVEQELAEARAKRTWWQRLMGR